MFVVPVVYLLLRRREIRRAQRQAPSHAEAGYAPR
jgi:hypothetical protein